MSIPDDELKKLREKYGPSYGWTSGAAEDRAEVVAIIDEALSRGADVRGLGGTIEGLQHHLSAVLAERDEARAALAKAKQERDAAKAATLAIAGAGLQIRAVAFEEAARWVDKRNVLLSADAARVYEDAEEHRAWTAAKIRALSSSPPLGQWVAADVMERVKAALSQTIPWADAWRRLGEASHGPMPSMAGAIEAARAALSALESEASR